MLLVITYDVDTTDAQGAKRLRKVAKLCERSGVRVQNSVFEVLVDAAQLVVLKAELSKIIDHERDSVRFYRLGNSYQHKIETMGRTPLVQAGEALLL
ncbi:CRISPR-associated endonuclease Cas2 [Pseudoflavonifractor phocaeensis]|uniref:CRISPR-associated endonuclease Cas2 n=1 Tax=Pseudoflavonifractor phocaeensis TaxID=1870988 RepID=UPI00195875DE|nr:CRISPR-associated endonuclease Cas2 [Pseudoflavonifractor phocaeensis]MBM6870139.1 CRISPR-associated endonuclease Cas2 [Pseudoflavonifractor phocaeensis]MBM6939041.1 CRISPR-associated endonuclease Cas2 [Pseudoflavonifractor phocaeensis]